MFNVDEVLKDGGLVQVQEGWQFAKVTDILQRTSKAGNQYVEITLQTENGKVWERLNLAHHSEKVREIAERILANLALACGLRSLRDPMQPNELMMKEVEIFVERDAEGFYRVKQYRSATQPVAAPAPAPAPAAETSAAFPDDDIPF
jgi:hypothetical protein